MQKQKLKKIIIGVVIGIILIGICARLFIFTEPIIITKSYIDVYPYTEIDGETIDMEWEYVKEKVEEKTDNYQVMYKGEKLPSDKKEDYIYIQHTFDLQRNSISGCSNIEIMYEKFNKYSENFIYSYITPFPMRLDAFEVKTYCYRRILMYVGGLSKEEIEQAVRGVEVSLLYTINHKTEKMACPISENVPICYTENEVEDEEEEYE